MKLTLWQQFASNHSNSFTLVGVFPTPEDAQAAAERLRKFLNHYIEWYKLHPDEAKELFYSDYPHELPQLEREFYQQENVQVEHSILEWVFALEDPIPLDSVLNTYENLLLMESSTDNAQGGKPFDELIVRWGGFAFVEAERGTKALYYHLEIAAPNEPVAVELEQLFLKDYGDIHDINEFAPWVKYEGGQLFETEQWERRQKLYNLWRQWYSGLEELQRTPKVALRLQRVTAHQAFDPLKDLSRSEAHRIWYMRNLNLIFKYANATIHRDKHQIFVDTPDFFSEAHVRGLPALIAWLKSLGCNVKVDFEVRE
jgi:hypothetical protein